MKTEPTSTKNEVNTNLLHITIVSTVKCCLKAEWCYRAKRYSRLNWKILSKAENKEEDGEKKIKKKQKIDNFVLFCFAK